MREIQPGTRGALLRDSVIFQLKLLADGARDVALVPISLVATLVGFLRGGDNADVEFRRVLELGRKSEQWINLFGTHEPLQEAGGAGSIDLLLTRAEQVVREQTRQGGITESASKAITRALDAAHRTAMKDQPKDRRKDI